ncbi:MAG: ATP-binding protein [Anaerolineales bacterium]|jgi:signal transduction histidine kinase
MTDPTQSTKSLKPFELEAVYSISKIVAEEVDLDRALEKIIHIARKVLIFDNAVVYLNEPELELEPFFARAIGRGKSTGSDLPWGDVAAKEAINSGQIYIREADINAGTSRLDQHFYLSLPMLVSGNISGALVFIRFGGPNYTQSHINIAQYITTHVSQLFEQKRLVEKIAELQAQQRLVQLQDDFVAMVSHELKTPLGFIKGYTTTLLRKDTTWDSDTQQEFLSIIDEEADRLSELIENLLDTYRLKSGNVQMKPKPTPLAPFFQGILDRLATQETNLEIILDVTPSDLIAYADSKRLTQVINNLISNASKYAPNSILEIKAQILDDKIHITFQDNGPGIPQEHIQHLFNRFYRVPERSGGVRGTGLGLFICKQIIEAHEGSIWVESELNVGTTFHILIKKFETTMTKEVKND